MTDLFYSVLGIVITIVMIAHQILSFIYNWRA